MTRTTQMIHLQVAEAGKRHSLRGDHLAALERYRHALHLALEQKANPVFMHHYTECILDGLEAAGMQDQALEMTDRALEEFPEAPGKLGLMLRASLTERKITLLYGLGMTEAADADLAEALHLGGPVLKDIAAARRRRLTLSPAWIAGVKQRHRGTTIREDALRLQDATLGEEYFTKEIAHG